MSKTPYEIRSDVLKLAIEHMQTVYDNNLQYAIQMTQSGADNAVETLKHAELLKTAAPYTFEEVLEKAKEMYSFVQKKD